MYSKIKWFNFGENRSISQAWKNNIENREKFLLLNIAVGS